MSFNRRFSPHSLEIKKALGANPGPVNVTATMNAGFNPGDSWVQDLEIGGGRIIGEACHYLDLLVYLTGSKISSICMNGLGVNPEGNTDNASILLKFENKFNGVINYFSNGSKTYLKECVEVFSQVRITILDNFCKKSFYGFKGFSSKKTAQDKDHKTQFALYNNFIKSGGNLIISFDEIVNVTRSSFAAFRSLKEKS